MQSSPEPMGLCPQYMQNFQCIGGSCEANCCDTPWTIHLDRKRYHQLKQALSHSQEDRELAQQAFKRNRSADSVDQNYALIVPSNGKCVFHEDSGLCAIHRRFGEDHLGQVCRTYPRMLRVMGNRLELTGTFSCPEVARRCLFDDQAMDVVRFDPTPFAGNRFACKKAPHDPTDPYIAQQDTLRDIALSVLADSNVSLQMRLFSLLYFAHRSQEFFYPQSELFSEAKLGHEVERLSNGIYQEVWSQNFAIQDLPAHLPMTVIQALLTGCYAKAAPELKSLLNAAWTPYARIDPQGSFLKVQHKSDTVALECRQLLDHYHKRAQRFGSVFQPRLDGCLARYLQNMVLKESYTEYPGLFAWAHDLVLRTALLSFLTISHPWLDPWVEPQDQSGSAHTEASLDYALEVFDKAIVEVMFRFSRGLEHNTRFLPQLKQSLQEQAMLDLPHAILLLKL